MGIHFKKILIFSCLLIVNFHSLKVFSNINWTSFDEEELYETNLNIDDANLDFTILTDGRYICNFRLRVSGNEPSSHGKMRGTFSFPDNSINMTYLKFQEFPEVKIIHSLNRSINKTYCPFQSDLELLVGVTLTLTGSFVGKYHSNTSDLYKYYLGIDWGGVVGKQTTTILLDARIIDLVDYNVPDIKPPSNYTDGNMVGYEWEDVVCVGFNGTFWVYPKKENPNLLKIDNVDWNVSINQEINLQIQNIGIFNLNIEISTPLWIDSNESEFSLMINETRTINFVITSQATSGIADTIFIKIIGSHKNYPLDIIEIPVDIGANIKLSDIIFFLFTISIICFVIPIIFYHQRLKINHYINQLRKKLPQQYISNNESIATSLSYNNVSKSREISWDLIINRWKSILPNKELKVLEILFNFGSMNQQTLANHLGVSKVTMSRLISRLESKRLIHRERLGMSKIIHLNEEVL